MPLESVTQVSGDKLLVSLKSNSLKYEYFHNKIKHFLFLNILHFYSQKCQLIAYPYQMFDLKSLNH